MTDETTTPDDQQALDNHPETEAASGAQTQGFAPVDKPVDPTPSTPNADVHYNPDGTVMSEAQEQEYAEKQANAGPLGMPAASADDAPFSTDTVPSGWSRYPTDEEVAYLNNKYTVD